MVEVPTLDKARRFDETYKVLLTVFTLLLSTAIAFYGRSSPEWAVFLFVLFASAVCLWSIGHLIGGKHEFSLKFLGWFMLLGGITQSLFVLYLGTLDLNVYYNAINWGVALFIYYLVFRYTKILFAKEDRKFFGTFFMVYVFLGVVVSLLKWFLPT